MLLIYDYDENPLLLGMGSVRAYTFVWFDARSLGLLHDKVLDVRHAKGLELLHGRGLI